MSTELLPRMIALIVVVGLCPGPANLLALEAGMRHDNRAAVRVWAGMATGFFIAALILAVVTHYVGGIVGHYVEWLRYVGAAYIVWLAWSIYRHGDETQHDTNTEFLHGLTVQLTNAKMIIFDLTIFTTFVLPYSSSFSALLGAIAWLVIAGPVANALWLMAGMWMRRLYERYRHTVSIVLAAALLLCALLLAL